MQKKKRKKKLGLLPKIIFAVFAVYAVVVISGQQIKINERKEEANALMAQIEEQKAINSELGEIIESAGTDEYYAEIARDKLGYVTRGERVFVDTSSM